MHWIYYHPEQKRPVFICCSCRATAHIVESGTFTPSAGHTCPLIGAERVQIIKSQARDNAETTDQTVRRRNGSADRPERAGRSFAGRKWVFQKAPPLSRTWAKRGSLGSGGEFRWKFRWKHGQVILLGFFVVFFFCVGFGVLWVLFVHFKKRTDLSNMRT